ncbi:oligosaccharide flippase family protein [Blastococcus sp. SYSU D00669]
MTGGARVAAVGAAWNYGAQVATVVVQLGYAAVTSRLLDAEAFGQYGVALTVAALITLVATAGLPQAISRMIVVESARLSSLLAYAVIVGGIAALGLVASADGWAELWNVDGVQPVLHVLAIGSFFAPAVAIGSGVLLRSSRFRALAGMTFGANIAGMGIGVLAVSVVQSPQALAASPVIAQAMTGLGCLFLGRRTFNARPHLRAALPDVAYSLRMTVSSLLSYAAGNVGKLSLGRAFGAPLLGHMNRAEVVTTTPFYQIQNSLIQALYPEFRHDISTSERARRVWADLLGLVAWVCLPIASVLAVLLPVFVPLVFGQGWAEVELLVPVLAIVGAVQTVVFVLVSALEVLARFRWIWAGHAIAIGVNIVGGVWSITSRSVVPVLGAILTGLVAMHGLHVWLSARAGLLAVQALVRHYSLVALVSIGLVGASLLMVNAGALARDLPWLLALGLFVYVPLAVICWTRRRDLPFVQLIRRYGVIRG